MGVIACIALVVIPGIGMFFSYQPLRRYRIDITPAQTGGEGDSPSPLWNILKPSHYSPAARPYLRTFWIWFTISQVCNLITLVLVIYLSS